MPDLRAALIGTGQMGRHHARVLSSMDGVHLVGALDPALSVGVLPPGARAYGSLSELIDSRIDIAVVASPTITHEEVGHALADAGIHTLVEKPVAASVDSAYRLADAFEKASLIGCVGHIERYNPALQELRRRLARGEIGEIYQVATRRQGPFPERISDVGVILDLATHDVDLTAWVTKRDYVHVSASTAHRSGRRHEDLVAAVATLDNGIVVNHLVNWLSPLKERVTVVSGERGTLIADTLNADLTFYANGAAPVEWESLQSFRGVVQGDVIRYALAKPEPLRVELEAFRDAVLGHDLRIVTMRDAASVVRVAEAMQASAETGSTVTVTRD